MSALDPTFITAFYRFLELNADQIQCVQSELETLALSAGLRGLCLLGPEGINATVSSPSLKSLEILKHTVRDLLGVEDIHFKDSVGAKHPFHVFRVKIKNEIVSLGKPGLAPTTRLNAHLSPTEWRKACQHPDVLILDTRNSYEVKLGKFKGAIDLDLSEFNEFPQKLKNANLPKDKPILMYCTGGIRCEKAILEMREHGFKQVSQLEGGILNYLEELPNQDFEGECFVFDYRIALDQQLQATRKYSLCPHCGQPAAESIVCIQCGRPEVLCTSCVAAPGPTCSRNCAHHAELGSNSTKTHLQEKNKRHRR